jgi:hypothetical protein
MCLKMLTEMSVEKLLPVMHLKISGSKSPDEINATGGGVCRG